MSRLSLEKQLRASGGAKGDIIARSASSFDNLPVGTNDQVLTADSTQALGVKWASPAAAGVSSVFGRSGAVVAAASDYDANQVDFTPAGNIAATDVQAAIAELDSEKQPLDATLTALAALDSTAGLLAVTAADTFARRTLTAPAAGFTITNPAGTAGNPTFVLADDLAAVEGLASNGLTARTASNTWTVRTITAGSSKLSVADGDGVAGNPTLDVVEANLDLDAIGGLLGIDQGGTGQTAATAAFDALAPTTTKGDIIVHNGTDNVRIGVGTDGQVLESRASEASGVRWVSAPAAAAGGSDTQVQFNNVGVLDGAGTLTWSQANSRLGLGGSPADVLFHVQEAVDGDSFPVLIENAQAASAASTNETAQIRFGFGGNNDVARISASKVNDYTSAANEDSALEFWTDDAGTAKKNLRLDNAGNLFLSNGAIDTTHISGNQKGLSIHQSNQIASLKTRTEWDTAGARSDWRNDTYSGINGNSGLSAIGFSSRGTVASPTALQSGDVFLSFQGAGYDGTLSTGSQARMQYAANENWSATAHGTEITFSTTPATTTTQRDSMILRGGGILEIDASADGDVVRIKQGGTQEGAITVSSTTVAYTTFMGAHPTQTDERIPQGAVVVATGELIAPELTVDENGKPVGRDSSRKARKKTDFAPEAHRFSRVAGTTAPLDKRVYGVYVSKNSDDTYGKSFGKEDEAEHLIAAVGLYMIRVTDTNGDIGSGDYLTSSNRKWEAQRQDDDTLHSYTVAKSVVAVDWSKVAVDPMLGYKWALIPATIHCG